MGSVTRPRNFHEQSSSYASPVHKGFSKLSFTAIVEVTLSSNHMWLSLTGSSSSSAGIPQEAKTWPRLTVTSNHI